MIKFLDSAKLAYIKLRTRRIRLFVSVFVASLLFSGLAAISIMFAGITTSMDSFMKEGLSKRYMIAGSYTEVDNISVTSNTALIARAEELEKQELKDRKASLKRLGLPSDDVAMERSVQSDSSGAKFINVNGYAAQQAVAEIAPRLFSKPTKDMFAKQVGVDASNISVIRRQSVESFTQNGPRLEALKDGKEDYKDKQGAFMSDPSETGLGSFASNWTAMDKRLMQPFVLKGQSLEVGKNGEIPIIVSYAAAQNILSMPQLPKTASTEQKKQRLADVRTKIAEKTFQVCYRNASSNMLLQTAINDQSALKSAAQNKEYKKPDLMHGLPESPCGTPVITRDVRDAETKSIAKKQLEYEKEFGKQDPVSVLYTFKVVGVSSDAAQPASSISAQDILYAFTQSSLVATWASPIDAIPDALKSQYFTDKPAAYLSSMPTDYYVAEFADATTARNVMKNKNCVVVYPGMPVDEETQRNKCSMKARAYSLQPFGSASLAIDQIQEGFRKVQLVSGLIIAAIASLILMGIVGRIIADSRRETAIFRAIGASKFSIMQIYGMYTVYLAVLIALVSFAIGLTIATYLNSQWSPEASNSMALMFNVDDLNKKFYFMAISTYDMLLLCGVIAAAAIAGATLPILLNIRRNPITDMRDE